MDNINTPNINTNATWGNLFRNCGDGGDATIPGADFMNQIMLEILVPVLETCQTRQAFDISDPTTFSQLWQAIQTGGGSCGIDDWTAATTKNIVKGSDCNYYLATPSGDKSVDPVGDTAGNWAGSFCSIGELLGYVVANLSSWQIQSVNCTTGSVTYSDGANTCTIGQYQPDWEVTDVDCTNRVVKFSDGTNTCSLDILGEKVNSRQIFGLVSGGQECVQVGAGDYYVEINPSSNSSSNSDRKWLFVKVADDMDVTISDVYGWLDTGAITNGNGTICADSTTNGIVQIRELYA